MKEDNKLINNLNHYSNKMYLEIIKYFEKDSNMEPIYAKVGFFGLTLHPNQAGLINFDILFLYKSFSEEANIEARIHDPYIHPSVGAVYGLTMGRHSEEDGWAYSFDVVVLSSPHTHYLKNIQTMAKLCKPHKACLFLDLFGGFTSLYGIGENISYIDFSSTSKYWGVSGGFVS